MRGGGRWTLSECGASTPLRTTKAKLKNRVSSGPQAVLENRPFVTHVDWKRRTEEDKKTEKLYDNNQSGYFCTIGQVCKKKKKSKEKKEKTVGSRVLCRLN